MFSQRNFINGKNMEKIKRNHIYQYRYTDKAIANSRMAYSNIKAYLFVQSLHNKDIARCKVVFLLEQPPKHKLKLNSWVYVPTANLCDPDIYPKYSNRPRQWVKFAKMPVVDAAVEILNEMSPTLHDELVTASTVITAAVTKRDLKVGQKWESRRDKLTLEKQWDQYYIVKNKFGDRDKYEPEELAAKLNTEKYKLTKSYDLKALLKALGNILKPVMGALAIGALLGIITKWIKK